MRILFIGDSFVNGTGDDDCLGWPGRLCAEARRRARDVTLYNLGVRRDTTADIAARWEREARARLPPEHDGRLVFSFGVNDCVEESPGRTRVDPEESAVNTRAFLAAASRWRPTLMVGPPVAGDAAPDLRVGRLSNRVGLVCRDLGVPFLSPREALAGSAAWRRGAEAGDGIHPNREGYTVLAGLVSSWPAWRAWLEEAA